MNPKRRKMKPMGNEPCPGYHDDDYEEQQRLMTMIYWAGERDDVEDIKIRQKHYKKTGARPKKYASVRFQKLPEEDAEIQTMDRLKAEEEASNKGKIRLRKKFPNFNFETLETYEDDMGNVQAKLFKGKPKTYIILVSNDNIIAGFFLKNTPIMKNSLGSTADETFGGE